jgi:hypothetical protein
MNLGKRSILNTVILVMAVVSLFIGCAGGAVPITDLPPESTTPSPLEGTWTGIEKGIAGPIETEYQFKGNTFVMRTINPNQGNVGGWYKGIFTYTNTEISLYILESLDPNYLRTRVDWARVVNGKTFKNSKKYKLISDTLSFGKSQFTKLGVPVKLPEEYVFFLNENNFLNSNDPNPFAFTITEIDNQAVGYVNMAFLGEGYRPAELKEPGTHKVSFRQKYRFTDKTNTRMEGETEGYFTQNFIPGVYEFSLYTPDFDAYMPSDLPAVPTEHIRIVIMRTEIGSGIMLYEYIDISTATPLEKR